MLSRTFSRRQFARLVGTGAGAAFILRDSKIAPALAETPRPPAESLIRLSSNENPYGPSPKALAAMTDSQRIASRYPDGLGRQIAEMIAKYHQVDPDNVLLGCGSGEILRIADMAFLSPGKNVVVAEPTFEAVLLYARVTRAEPVKIPLTPDFRHDLPKMAAACTERTGLVYVCNPNNPTATIVTRDEMAAFIPRVPKSAVILLDEAYHHFVEDPHYQTGFELLGKVPNLLVVRTFSKVFGMAGMRLGYAVAAKDLIAQMQEHVLSSNGNAAVLEAAAVSLNDANHVAEQRKLNNETRRWLCAELNRDRRRYIPSHANFVMIEAGADVRPIIDEFRKRNIIVGRKFPSLGTWLRVSIGTRAETEAFLRALREILPARISAAA